MVSCKAVVILLEVYAAAVLTSQIEAFVTIFVHGELQRLQVRRMRVPSHMPVPMHPCSHTPTHVRTQSRRNAGLSEAQASLVSA